jgi:hypothetical protein
MQNLAHMFFFALCIYPFACYNHRIYQSTRSHAAQQSGRMFPLCRNRSHTGQWSVPKCPLPPVSPIRDGCRISNDSPSLINILQVLGFEPSTCSFICMYANHYTNGYFLKFNYQIRLLTLMFWDFWA